MTIESVEEIFPPDDLGGYEDANVRAEAIQAVADVLHDLGCISHTTGSDCTCYRHDGDADHLQAHAILSSALRPGPVANAFRALLPEPAANYEALWNSWAGSVAAMQDIDGELSGAVMRDHILDEITRDALHAMRSIFADDASAAWSAMSIAQRHQATHDFGGFPMGALQCCRLFQEELPERA